MSDLNGLPRLDHGLLNVPLAKRGNIDAEIDRYKARIAADQKRERKAAAAETKVQRAQAKALIAALSVERLDELRAAKKLTRIQLLKKLSSTAYFNPGAIIAALGTNKETACDQ